ncbi:MAG TPA: hypothetical protein VGM10_35990 [Actinocrinis sp.]
MRLGRIYYGAITVVLVTAAGLTALRPREDYPVLLIGAFAFAAATIGFRHRRRHRPGDDGHIAGMGISYAALLTAFYVDNAQNLPLFDRLPPVAVVLLPGAVAVPIILSALHRARTRRRSAETGHAGGEISAPPEAASARH